MHPCLLLSIFAAWVWKRKKGKEEGNWISSKCQSLYQDVCIHNPIWVSPWLYHLHVQGVELRLRAGRTIWKSTWLPNFQFYCITKSLLSLFSKIFLLSHKVGWWGNISFLLFLSFPLLKVDTFFYFKFSFTCLWPAGRAFWCLHVHTFAY